MVTRTKFDAISTQNLISLYNQTPEMQIQRYIEWWDQHTNDQKLNETDTNDACLCNLAAVYRLNFLHFPAKSYAKNELMCRSKCSITKFNHKSSVPVPVQWQEASRTCSELVRKKILEPRTTCLIPQQMIEAKVGHNQHPHVHQSDQKSSLMMNLDSAV